jgi:NAD(P)H-hydrate epimerase
VTIRFTREQVRTLDRLAVERYGIPSIVLMENAAIGASAVALGMLGNTGQSAQIYCGTGNNGGDGLAMARHLHNAGVNVAITLVGVDAEFSPDALVNYRIACNMGLSVSSFAPGVPIPTDLVIDAIFGTGLSRAPTGIQRDAIEQINSSKLPVLAVDVPSGLDCDTGRVLGACVRATRTVTFVAEKVGFLAARSLTGEIDVVGIGAPRQLIELVARRC